MRPMLPHGAYKPIYDRFTFAERDEQPNERQERVWSRVDREEVEFFKRGKREGIETRTVSAWLSGHAMTLTGADSMSTGDMAAVVKLIEPLWLRTEADILDGC